jgi:hypothetical protein
MAMCGGQAQCSMDSGIVGSAGGANSSSSMGMVTMLVAVSGTCVKLQGCPLHKTVSGMRSGRSA